MQNNKIEHLLMLKTAMSSSAEGIIIVDCFSCPVFINSTGHKLIRHKLSLTLPLKQQVELLGLSHPDGYKMLFAEGISFAPEWKKHFVFFICCFIY